VVLATPAALPTVGSLVRTRGRDWVVLSIDHPDVVRLRPLTGSEEDAIGMFWPLEHNLVASSSFAPPDPTAAGDSIGGILLQDAARLSIRNGAAPFRSLGRLTVVPRPYQFVPLIMALRLDPVRLLIADDVGVGKTIEAAMIARELLDRGVAKRLAVICPAHLCEQWQTELHEKFGIDAVVVQSATIGRLLRAMPRSDVSLYQYYPHIIVSIDFVKSDTNRHGFLLHAPDLVIVDEAHMAARPGGNAGTSQHQRHQFVHELTSGASRHVILVSATPHSGIEESFRSVLGLLDPAFDRADIELDRKALIKHLVQRRRSDLETWLGAETPFPDRVAEERAYPLSGSYRSLYVDVLEYCRESIASATDTLRRQQRVRHWAAIALLRCVLSSPEAAIAVLSERAKRQGLDEIAAFDSEDEMDAAYRPQVLDPMEEGDSGDYAPTAPLQDADPDLSDSERRHLSSFLRRARDLAGSKDDAKLVETARIVAELLKDGYHPIVFCRFIATAKYLEAQLPKLLPKSLKDVQVSAVTGEIGDEQRRERVEDLSGHPVRVLVATDCLSEGINLQEHYDAVVHYDLPWNPNRLEQREGRVDRFGQQRREVKTIVLYGADSEVDLVVLDVLLRKARTIRKQLGISVPVPAESDGVVQAVVDSVLLRRPTAGRQLGLALSDPGVSRLHDEWDRSADRQRKQRAHFAQEGIRPEEVQQELEAVDPVLGDARTVQRFLANAAQRLGGDLRPTKHTGVFNLVPGTEMHRTLHAREIAVGETLRVSFEPLMNSTETTMLTRMHPVIAAYCDAVLGRAMGPNPDPRFARCSAMVTDAVTVRTVCVLLRLRYLLHDVVDEFAEEIVLAAFHRRGGEVSWVQPWDSARGLLADARPRGNLDEAEQQGHIQWALDLLGTNHEWHQPIIEWRTTVLRDSNDRLRSLLKANSLRITPHTPPDILGLYVLVPGGA
jgi:superfamily II DNA or RNA helicase